jgi:hypothetical protein
MEYNSFKRRRSYMNIWQKICLAVGAIVIAIILINPITNTKEVVNPAYNPKEVGLFYGEPPTRTIAYKDYTATALSSVGVAFIIGAIVVVLGFAKPKDN